MTELEVAKILAEIVDAFFSEQGLHIEETIAQSDKRNVFLHEKLHRTIVVLWKFLIEVGACLEEERNKWFELLLL